MAEQSFDAVTARLCEAAPGAVNELVVPRMPVLAVHGSGSLGTTESRQAVRDLFAVAFAVKMLPRTRSAPTGHHEYEMPPMQAVFDSLGRMGKWRILFPQPDFVTAAVVADARAQLGERDADSDVVLETHDEGLSVQTLHVGPFTDELRAIQLLHDYAKSRGHELQDHHHEIYLDDPQKVDPADMRTVIRYPVRVTR